MIGQIRGKLLEKLPPQLVIEAHGVGYEIDAPMSTFYQLPDVGQETILFTHFVVREDAHHLYGFASRDERLLFKSLLKVNGVGPRLALTILSSVSPSDFVRIILNNEADNLVRIPGVGKKTAERLVIEMRDKLSSWYEAGHEAPQAFKPEEGGRHQTRQDAISALIALGYKQHEASRTISKVDDGVISSEELIRLALREMM